MAEADGTGMETPAAGRVGQRLRAAREAAGLDIKQLSQRTKVTLRHLELIEGGDFAQLPGKPYAIGFARSYARAVGLDDKEVADAVRAELRDTEPAAPARVIHQYDIGDPVKTPSSRLTWLAVIAALAVTLFGFVAWRSFYWPASGLPPIEPPAPPPQPQAVAPPPAAAAAGPVVFTALEDGVWVRFYDAGGAQLLEKQLVKGESYTVPAEASGPQIWTGRPDALSITIGGQPVPKLADAQMTMKDVPVSAEALLARAAAPAAVPGTPGPQSSTAAM